MYFLKTFNYKEAKRIIESNSTKDKIVDKYDNEYDVISKSDKKENKIFVGKEGEQYYKYFTLDGKEINGDNQLFIKTDIDSSEVDLLFAKNKSHILCKLNNDDYLMVFLCDKPLYLVVHMKTEQQKQFESRYDIMTHDDKHILYEHLYDLDIYYDIVNHCYGKLEKNLKKDEWYCFYNTIFKAKCDMKHDMRTEASIPYEVYYDFKIKTIYENSSLGLPRYIGLRKAEKSEIIKFQQDTKISNENNDFTKKMNDYYEVARAWFSII